MAIHCTHLNTIRDVTPSALGCEECLRLGQAWVHLRICRACGHVGCCDSSPGRHATKHFHATRHPIIEGYDPPEGWGWCFVDKVDVRSLGPNDPAHRSDPALLLSNPREQRRVVAREEAWLMSRDTSVVTAKNGLPN